MQEILSLIKAGWLWRDAWIILVPILTMGIMWIIPKIYYWLRRKYYRKRGYEDGLEQVLTEGYKRIKYYKQGHAQGDKEWKMLRLLEQPRGTKPIPEYAQYFNMRGN